MRHYIFPEPQDMYEFYLEMKKYRGHSGLLSQKDLDQGDTCQRVGTLMLLLCALHRHDENWFGPTYEAGHLILKKALEKLSPKWGVYARSPDPSYWGSNPNNLSRDQLSMLKAGLTLCGGGWAVWKNFQIFVRQLTRLGFHQNIHIGTDVDPNDPKKGYKIPDLIGIPAEISMYLRAFLGPLSIPINTVLDCGFFVDLWLRKKQPHDYDNMLAAYLILANEKAPTPTARLAMKMYLKTDFMQRLKEYHGDRPGNNGCMPLYQLYKRYFKVAWNKEE